MKLFYYASSVPNFGDELNPWLWPQLLPGVFDDQTDDAFFVGIGTLLQGNLPRQPRAAVFGTGCHSEKLSRQLPPSWKIYGVRGPLTARALGLAKDAALGDGALLLRTLCLAQVPITYRVSFMPHFHSALLGKWPEVCRAIGIHFIDPTWPVETVLHHIRSSRRLISSAMHGAIVADTFRIPWTPVPPFGYGYCFKWQDWAETLGLNFQFSSLAPTTPDELIHHRLPRLRSYLQGVQRKLHPPTRRTFDRINPLISTPFVPEPIRQWMIPRGIERATNSLAAALKQHPYLSSDAALDRVTTRLQERLALFHRDHANGMFASA